MQHYKKFLRLMWIAECQVHPDIGKETASPRGASADTLRLPLDKQLKSHVVC